MQKLSAKQRRITLLIIAIALAGLVHPAAAQSDKLGYLRIKAQYPTQVLQSYTFQVNVTVQYAFREYYEIQAAIYEGPKGTLGTALWQGPVDRLLDVSEKKYSAQLKSPAKEGEWVVTGYAFYQLPTGPGYFSDNQRGPGFFEMRIIVADNAKLTVRTPHGNMPVTIDEAALATDKNGLLIQPVKVLADHRVTVPEELTFSDGWRAEFLSWNGTDQRNVKLLTITRDVFLIADYQDEYRLDVVSDAGHVSGAGWYLGGAVANFSVPMLVPQEGVAGWFGIQLRFTGWSGDIKGSTNTESVVMDRPYRVVANWAVNYEQSFYLTIGIALLAGGALVAFVVRRTISGKHVEEDASLPPREYCIHCGENIDPDAKFCLKCGESQVTSE